MMKSQLIISNRFRRALYNKKSFLIMLLIPIIAVVIGSIANTLSTPELNIAVASSENAGEAYTLSQKLNAVEGIKSRYYGSLNGKTDLIMGNYDISLNLHSDGNIDYTTIRRSADEKNIRKLIEDINNAPESSFSIDNYLTSNALSSIEKILSFMVLMLLITCTVNSSFIIQDKEFGLYDRVKASPMSMSAYITGNVIYNFMLTYAQIIIAMTIVFLIQINMNIQFTHMLFIGFLMSLVTTSFGTLMTVLFDKELYANLFSSVIALIFSLFGGTFIAFTEMPRVLRAISIISPTRWFIQMAEILNSNYSITLLLPYVVLSLLFVAVAFTLSATLSLKNR